MYFPIPMTDFEALKSQAQEIHNAMKDDDPNKPSRLFQKKLELGKELSTEQLEEIKKIKSQIDLFQQSLAEVDTTKLSEQDKASYVNLKLTAIGLQAELYDLYYDAFLDNEYVCGCDDSIVGSNMKKINIQKGEWTDVWLFPGLQNIPGSDENTLLTNYDPRVIGNVDADGSGKQGDDISIWDKQDASKYNAFIKQVVGTPTPFVKPPTNQAPSWNNTTPDAAPQPDSGISIPPDGTTEKWFYDYPDTDPLSVNPPTNQAPSYLEPLNPLDSPSPQKDQSRSPTSSPDIYDPSRKQELEDRIRQIKQQPQFVHPPYSEISYDTDASPNQNTSFPETAQDDPQKKEEERNKKEQIFWLVENKFNNDENSVITTAYNNIYNKLQSKEIYIDWVEDITQLPELKLKYRIQGITEQNTVVYATLDYAIWWVSYIGPVLWAFAVWNIDDPDVSESSKGWKQLNIKGQLSSPEMRVNDAFTASKGNLQRMKKYNQSMIQTVRNAFGFPENTYTYSVVGNLVYAVKLQDNVYDVSIYRVTDTSVEMTTIWDWGEVKEVCTHKIPNWSFPQVINGVIQPVGKPISAIDAELRIPTPATGTK